jgi:hypothetical protein
MAYESYQTEPVVGDPRAIPRQLPVSTIRQPGGWDPSYTEQPVAYRMSSQALGATNTPAYDLKEIVKSGLMLVGALAILYVVYQGFFGGKGGSSSPKSNGGGFATPTPKGKNRIVRIVRRANGTYWYRLIRKGSKYQGPFASRETVQKELDRKGYEAVR